jgi:hypothetical protein
MLRAGLRGACRPATRAFGGRGFVEAATVRYPLDSTPASPEIAVDRRPPGIARSKDHPP